MKDFTLQINEKNLGDIEALKEAFSANKLFQPGELARFGYPGAGFIVRIQGESGPFGDSYTFTIQPHPNPEL